MIKKQLAAIVARKTGLSESKAVVVINTVLETVSDAVSKGDCVQLSGFGVFEPKETAPRKGRNAMTNESIHIPARKTLGFRVSKSLREKLNN